MKRRVVVTGLGALTPLGLNITETWEGILKSKSGVRRIETFDVSEYTSRISGSVRHFEVSKFLSSKEARKMDVFIQFAVAASHQALADSNLAVTPENAHRIGVSVGAGICGLPAIEASHATLLKEGPKRLSPFFIPAIVTNMASGNVSIQFGLKGPNVSIVSACATGTHCIGLAARMIAYGDADVMLAGGTEMATSPLGLGGFCALRALSTRNDEPERASRPWDKDRDGFVMGDGAGVMVLESLEHAIQRGAKIYAELVGFGMSADAHHITLSDPEGRGASLSMEVALRDASLNPSDIDYINAHGTSTQAGDLSEVIGVKRVFGAHAYQLAMSSTKSMTGHLLGATGAVEAIFSVLAIRDQVAPPTINLDHPDEGFDLNFVPHTAQPRKIKAVLSNSFGFGGTNATLIFKQFDG